MKTKYRNVSRLTKLENTVALAIMAKNPEAVAAAKAALERALNASQAKRYLA